MPMIPQETPMVAHQTLLIHLQYQKFGSAAVFDGYNSEIDANNVSALNNLTEISVSLWF